MSHVCSSLGQNLQTSNHIWESCFAIFISIAGLLLFLYLIGNVQVSIQFFSFLFSFFLLFLFSKYIQLLAIQSSWLSSFTQIWHNYNISGKKNEYDKIWLDLTRIWPKTKPNAYIYIYRHKILRLLGLILIILRHKNTMGLSSHMGLD